MVEEVMIIKFDYSNKREKDFIDRFEMEAKEKGMKVGFAGLMGDSLE